ncbi:hypothetical protein QE417_003649 [Mucilaginibacter terrae]|uniref:Uncharacterized protein n=1 Tax=Mucilaginibacter terrae TaxID=1955052 RepID=A0ABU3GXT4_9SPHI|nr:hypothetical protein [Mucilaginibacter terrae]
MLFFNQISTFIKIIKFNTYFQNLQISSYHNNKKN